MDLEGGRQGEVAMKGKKEGAAKEGGQGRGWLVLIIQHSLLEQNLSPGALCPAPGCSQDLGQLPLPSGHLPQLVRCQCPIWSQPFRGKKGVLRGTQKEVSQWRVAP